MTSWQKHIIVVKKEGNDIRESKRTGRFRDGGKMCCRYTYSNEVEEALLPRDDVW